jgi:uncharacterized membrane-anchored protein YhcB (DUF1043 family)
MNGNAMTLLLWIANGLAGIVLLLVGVILRMHAAGDAEHRRRYETELEKLRARMHDAESQIAGWAALAKSKGWL